MIVLFALLSGALLSGCMTLDGFFFNPVAVDAYTLSTAVIPAENLEEVSFPALDERTLYGVWAHANDPGLGQPDPPVVIYFHGNGGNIDTNYGVFEVLWTLGYEVFIFDYGGYGKSQGSPDYQSVIDDGTAAIAYVSEHTSIGYTSLVYYGTSLGGFSAIQNARTFPPWVLITDSMFSSADLIVDQSSGLDLPTGWVLADPYNNLDAAQDVHIPLLIMHGEDDDFVNISHGDAVYAAANPPKFFWRVPGGEHATLHTDAPEDFDAHVTCWVSQDPTCISALEGESVLEP